MTHVIILRDGSRMLLARHVWASCTGEVVCFCAYYGAITFEARTVGELFAIVRDFVKRNGL